MKIDCISIINNDIWNFLLIIMGIALSLFTLLYSFILSKKDQLLEISFIIKRGDKDPLFIQKQNNAIRYIKNLKNYNDKLIVATVYTFFLSFITWLFDKFSKIIEFKYVIIGFYTILLLTFLILAYFIYIILLLFKSYIKDTRIE